MTEQIKDYNKIDWRYYDSNYTVSCSDIEATQIVDDGLRVSELEETTIKAILHLLGMDVDKPYERLQLPEGAGYHSELTGTVQVGGYVFSGVKRTDERWKKLGFKGISVPYLFGNKVSELKRVMNNV